MATSFTIDRALRVTSWDDQAARLLDISRDDALGYSCADLVHGRDDFGRAVCSSNCPATRALATGGLQGRAHIVADTAEGRQRLTCELTALPDGQALGHLRETDARTPLLDLAGIAALTARLANAPLPKGLQDAIDFLLHACGAEAGEIFLVQPGGERLIRTSHRGLFARLFAEQPYFDAGMGFPGLALSRREFVGSHQLAQDPDFLRQGVVRADFRTYLCMPLLHRDTVVGCLGLACRRDDIDIDRARTLLHWIAAPLALAIDASLAGAQQKVRVLLDELANDPWQLRPVLKVLLHEFLRTGGAQAAALYLPWREGGLRLLAPQDASLPACAGASGDGSGCPAMAGHTMRLLQGRRDAWPAACRHMSQPGGAWVCIPLTSASRSCGMIRLRYQRVRPAPPAETEALLAWMAAAASEKLNDVCSHQGQTPHPVVLRGASRTRSHEHTREPTARWGDARLAICALGDLQLAVDGHAVPGASVTRQRVWTLLGFLLTHHDTAQSKDELLEALWPDDDPARRGSQLHVLVHELRRLVEPTSPGQQWRYVQGRAGSYWLQTGSSCWIDVVVFRELLEQARCDDGAGDLQSALAAYESAAKLYCGDYLQDQPYAEWSWPLREQLRQDGLHAHARLCTLWAQRDRWDLSLHWARRALRLDPLDEAMHRSVMQALWATGRRQQAIRQYHSCADLLRRQLDVTPLPKTTQLLANIRANVRPI